MTEEKVKPDITISGKEITFDKRKITKREWRRIWEPAVTDEEESAILAKFAGVTVEFLDGLSLNDYQLFIKAATACVQSPPDPN